jgi:hypothetical protein
MVLNLPGLYVYGNILARLFHREPVEVGSLKTLCHGRDGWDGRLRLLANCSARKSQQADTNGLQLANQVARSEARAEHGSPAVRSILPNSSCFVAKIRQLTFISPPGLISQSGD